MARDKLSSEAINALGGTYAVAVLFGIDPKVVSNWRTRGLPPDTYHVMAPLLARKGFTFTPDDLFKQRAMASEDALAEAREQATKARINYERRKAKRKR